MFHVYQCDSIEIYFSHAVNFFLFYIFMIRWFKNRRKPISVGGSIDLPPPTFDSEKRLLSSIYLICYDRLFIITNVSQLHRRFIF